MAKLVKFNVGNHAPRITNFPTRTISAKNNSDNCCSNHHSCGGNSAHNGANINLFLWRENRIGLVGLRGIVSRRLGLVGVICARWWINRLLLALNSREGPILLADFILVVIEINAVFWKIAAFFTMHQTLVGNVVVSRGTLKGWCYSGRSRFWSPFGHRRIT